MPWRLLAEALSEKRWRELETPRDHSGPQHPRRPKVLDAVKRKARVVLEKAINKAPILSSRPLSSGDHLLPGPSPEFPPPLSTEF